MKELFVEKSNGKMIKKLTRLGLICADVAKQSLDRDFPKVFQALTSFWDDPDKKQRLRGLVAITNKIKHEMGIALSKQAGQLMIAGPKGLIAVLPFYNALLVDVTSFATCCISTYEKYRVDQPLPKSSSKLNKSEHAAISRLVDRALDDFFIEGSGMPRSIYETLKKASGGASKPSQ